MEPVVIKKGKTLYSFYSNRMVMAKKEKVVHEIYYHEIKEITYNPKYGLRDFLGNILALSPYRLRDAFVIELKVQKGLSNFIRIMLSNDEFEKIKDVFGIPIELV
jgi:hypothetical protein